MDGDIHTDALIFRTTVLSEGLRLLEATVERVVDIIGFTKRSNKISCTKESDGSPRLMIS